MAELTVRLPRLLAPVADGERTVQVSAATPAAALAALVERHPGLRTHLFDDDGMLRRHVLVFAEGEPVGLDDQLLLAEGSEVAILQSVAGGA